MEEVDFRDTVPEGLWEYKAHWRSTMGSVTILLLLFAALSFFVAFGARNFSFGWACGGLVCAGFAWLLGKPLFTGAWIVRIGPRGISGYHLNGRTVPWHDVRDLAVETVQRNTFLVLHLAPGATESLARTRRRLSGRKPERRILLNGLRKEEIAQVTAAALATFAERASTHAAAAAQARQEEARFEAAFTQELAQKTKTTWALYLVVALNVGVWLLGVFKGISPFAPATADLFRWGANSAWAVTRDHDYWRLLTGTFLHGGAMHLLMNMVGLWGGGRLLNRLYGNPQFLLVYLLSALAASAASLHFGAQTAVAVGASGAVFGVVSALVVAVRKNHAHLPRAMTRQIVTSEGAFLLYALLNGFTHRGIDNAAHVGGLLAGAALAWLLAPVTGPATPAGRAMRAAGVSAGLLVAVGALVATTPSPQVDHRQMFAATERLQQAMPKLQAAQAALQSDAQATNKGQLTQAQLIERTEAVHLPALRQVQADLRRIPLAQGDPRADLTRDLLQIADQSVQILELEVRQQHGQALQGDQARLQSLQRELQEATRRVQERSAAMRAKRR